jgi:hypothetical protein
VQNFKCYWPWAIILGQPKMEIWTINLGPRECAFPGYVQWLRMLPARKKRKKRMHAICMCLIYLIIEKFSDYYIYLYGKLYFCIEINGVQRKRTRFSS